MEQFIISLTQDQVVNFLTISFGFMLISLICTFGGFLNKSPILGGLSLVVLISSMVSFAQIKSSINDYHKSLGKEYQVYQNNFDLILVKNKKNERVSSEILTIKCSELETLKDCLSNLSI